MEVFESFYKEKVQELEKKHEDWVSSNKKMRSIELALRQIKTEGDTKIAPAVEVLKTEYGKEKAKNDTLATEMYALKGFVHSMEIEAHRHGATWDRTTEIFGY